MNHGYRTLSDQILNEYLAEYITPVLENTILNRSRGHCMRVSDLNYDLVLEICTELRRRFSADDAQIYILSNEFEATEDNLHVSSTKVVELRNPLSDGTLRPPLLIFIPPNTQASAEDSFGVATFEEIGISDVYDSFLSNELFPQIPEENRETAREYLNSLNNQWQWADKVAQVKYLLTVILNGVDSESLGAALYELGLIPDFRLFSNEAPEFVKRRIQVNLEAVQTITNSDLSTRGRILELDLIDSNTVRQLIDLLLRYQVNDPKSWTRQIILDKVNWQLSFDKWQFANDKYDEEIEITVTDTDLPVATDEDDDRLQALIGQRVLAPAERRNFKVFFEVDPHPTQVMGLDYFTLQIMAKDIEGEGVDSPIGVSKKVKAWKSKSVKKTVTISKLNKMSLEEGWHFIRVLPWTVDGDPISVKDNFVGRRSSHDSDLFYVLPGEEFGEIPPQRALQKASSVEQARLRLQFTALTDNRPPSEVELGNVGWAGKSRRSGIATEYIAAEFGKFGTWQIPVSSVLAKLEQSILASPNNISSWSLEINRGVVGEAQKSNYTMIDIQPMRAFVDARERFFSQVRGTSGEMIMQAADLIKLSENCFHYANAYLELIANIKKMITKFDDSDTKKIVQELRSLLMIDSIFVTLTGFSGDVREAVLVSPTHPLRALWLTNLVHVSQHWMQELLNAPDDYIALTRDALLQQIEMNEIPATVPVENGRIFVPIGNMNTHWTVFASTTETDSRSLMGDLSTALSVSSVENSNPTVSAMTLAKRIEKYLIQHPYVMTLVFNVFNPGRAELIAEALKILQSIKSFSSVRYDIRLFVSRKELEGVGEALYEMLTPERTGGSAEVDAFSRSTGSHLVPKLGLAINTIDEFHEFPDSYDSHITLLLDYFPPSEVAASEPIRNISFSPMYGLVQDYMERFVDDDEIGTFWQRQPRYGQVANLPTAEEPIYLLNELSEMFSQAVAAVSTSRFNFDLLPIITTSLDSMQRRLLNKVHEKSDWVLTVDRNIGVEYFDHGGRKERPEYLIDYVPTTYSYNGSRLITTTRSQTELQSILRPIIDQYGLRIPIEHQPKILSSLRSLSGRVTLKLVSSANQQAEALGLSLARLFLEKIGSLENQIIVPLDDYPYLFRKMDTTGDISSEHLILRRTDLALFDFDLDERIVKCHLVEVKCHYNNQNSISSFDKLKTKIEEQLSDSMVALRSHFDPQHLSSDRPDRALKTYEFVQLLRYHTERSFRYGLLDSYHRNKIYELIDNLDEGYQLKFSKSGLIFDFHQDGVDPVDYYKGIQIYRIGIDTIQQLISFDQPDDGVSEEVSEVFKTAPFLQFTMYKLKQNNDDPIDEPSNQVEQIPIETIPQEKDNEHLNTSGTDNGEDSDTEQELSLSDLSHSTQLDYDVLIGLNDNRSQQSGIIGEVSGRKISLDLNETHTISLFGVQGSGKSYTLGSLIENATTTIPSINDLQNPLATVVFHYSQTQDYEPEFTSMVDANNDIDQLEILKKRYNADPQGLKDVVLLVPSYKIEERRQEFPYLEIHPILFAPDELKASHWKFLMGAVGNQSMYIRQINLIMRKLRNNLTLDGIRQQLDESPMSRKIRETAEIRLMLAEEYISERTRLSDIVRPGRLILVDLRDEAIEKDDALGLFVVMLQIFSDVLYQGKTFNKLIVFDEAHKYMDSPDLISGLVEVVREMRHKGTNILVASQEPRSVPVSLIELSTEIILHRFNSPEWLKHIQKANIAMKQINPDVLNELKSGEAYVWSSKSRDASFTNGAVKVKLRPRVSRHGGETKKAVD